MKTIEINKLMDMFEEAHYNFLNNNKILIERDLHERCLVSNLGYELRDLLSKYSLDNYYVDVEFNRDEYNIKKLISGKIKDENNPDIICDLIVHDRHNSNLLAFEMKKANNDDCFENDRKRLKILTKQESNNYNYKLGVFYILKSDLEYTIEYYVNGSLINKKTRL